MSINQLTASMLATLTRELGPAKYAYVLGFVHSDTHVLLRNTDVEWMEGAVNGYGGKIKADDGPEQAMTRTYMEQTGSVDRGFAPEWRYLGVIRGVDYAIFVYSMFDEDIEEHFKDRLHELYSIDDLDDINCVYDVPEMIRMSLSQHSFADNQEFVWIRRTQEAADWEEDPQT